MGSIDVEDVQRYRHLGNALRFGDQLLGKHGGRHHVEDLDRVEADRSLATEAPRRKRMLGPLQTGVVRSVAEGGEQVVTVGEAAMQVERATPAAAAMSARVADGDCASMRSAASRIRSLFRTASARRRSV